MFVACVSALPENEAAPYGKPRCRGSVGEIDPTLSEWMPEPCLTRRADLARPVTIAVVQPATQARPDQNYDQAHERSVEKEFPITAHSVRPPEALTPLFPRNNVHKANADPDDAHHQKCAGQNKISHDNVSSLSRLEPNLMPEILAFRAKTLFDYASARLRSGTSKRLTKVWTGRSGLYSTRDRAPVTARAAKALKTAFSPLNRSSRQLVVRSAPPAGSTRAFSHCGSASSRPPSFQGGSISHRRLRAA